ncbi:MAG: sulfite exporter TauE/SafE family protein, partial [Anaerolineales bacterium]|nr:sulfite exporter TauE/SafE family protein [Anaerolineales bacterium]
LSDQIYYSLLYTVLSFVAFRLLYFSKRNQANEAFPHSPPRWAALLTGFGIGLLSGIVGIGGGIFLSPIIILAGWGTPKQSSAVAAAFIVLNSVSGLAGRVSGENFIFGQFGMMLLPFGLLGALCGSWLGAQRLNSLSLRRVLGVVMSFAVTNYWWKLLV